MNDYFDELIRSMNFLATNDKVKFIGQSVEYDGHALFKSMRDVPNDKRFELPVSEDFQMGVSIGLSLEGWIPVNIYPRFDFLIIAANQITNHLANISVVSDGKFKTKVITRVCVGATSPLYPGPQHCQNHTESLKMMCRGAIDVIELTKKDLIFSSYKYALERDDYKSTILIEYGNLYHTD